jgi:hypothetical protein
MKVAFIKIIVFTVFILTATFSTCITVLYYQKSQEYSILSQRYVHTQFKFDRLNEILEEKSSHSNKTPTHRDTATHNNNNNNNKNNNNILPPPTEVTLPPQSSDVLILTILKDNTSFGSKRTIKNYIHLIKSFSYNPKKISVGMLISDQNTYDEVQAYWKKSSNLNYFNQIKIFHKLCEGDNSIGRSDRLRHAPSIQKKRRSLLARYRNLLLSLTLGNIGMDVDNILWIDADMAMIPSNIIETFQKTQKKIVTVQYVKNNIILHTFHIQ